MREHLVQHLANDEMVLSSREAAPSLDVLEQRPVHDPVVYPVIDCWLTGHKNGFLGDPQPTPKQRVWHRYVLCCFHDLFSATDQELAGMGCVIIGNLCRLVAQKELSSQADARLELTLGKGAEPIALPWPAMPDARPLPLDLAALPFEWGMFLGDDDHKLKKRVDRMQLMHRIEETWVTHLKTLLVVKL